MNNDFLSRKNIELLPKRIKYLNVTNSSNMLYDYLWKLQKNSNHALKILVVGTGGSYPAAIFAKYSLVETFNTIHVDSCTPQSALRILIPIENSLYNIRTNYDLVISISYSGKTPDIKAVYNACLKNNIKFLLITGCEISKLSEIYEPNPLFTPISYFNENDTTGKENSMISIFSTIAPALVLTNTPIFDIKEEIINNSLVECNEFLSKLNLENIANTLKSTPIIHIFYEWDTLACAIDLESKITESGIAHVILHEKKDFSHGRCTLLLRQNFGLVINLTRYNSEYLYKTKYECLLSNYLKDTCQKSNAHYVEIGNTAPLIPQWNIQTLILTPFLVSKLGEYLNIDVSKHFKPFPKDAILLYNYEGNL